MGMLGGLSFVGIEEGGSGCWGYGWGYGVIHIRRWCLRGGRVERGLGASGVGRGGRSGHVRGKGLTRRNNGLEHTMKRVEHCQYYGRYVLMCPKRCYDLCVNNR